MPKPNRPGDAQSGKWHWHQWLHDAVVDPLLDDDGNLVPGVGLPDGGSPGQVVTQDPDGLPMWGNPQGPQGDPGLTWRGEWDDGEDYEFRDAVRHDGTIWFATVDEPGEPGVDGWETLIGPASQVELSTSDTHVRWRYVGETEWSDLVALEELEGPQGEQGDQGVPGPQGLVWQGTWDDQASYDVHDAVADEGSSWIATAPNTNSKPSTANPDWDRLARSAEFEDAVLNDLNDVDTAGASEGDALVYDGVGWGPGDVAVDALDDLGDVEAESPAAGDALVWNDTEGRWEPDARVTPQQLVNATDDLVEKSGDSMTGMLTVESGTEFGHFRVTRGTAIADLSVRADGGWLLSSETASGLGNESRAQYRPTLKDGDGSFDFLNNMLIRGDVEVQGDLDVDGAKNARIADPDDDTKAYRFAAMEADEPGLLVKRLRNVEVDNSRESRIPVPEHFARIGADPMVFATYAQEPQGQTPHGPWAFVDGWDTGSPEVVLRAPQGVYHLLLTFCRNDAGVGGWEHVVTVDQGDGE